MIIGTGVDLVEIARIRELDRRWGGRFLNRVFTDRELERCARRREPWPCLAARFAAKEAAMKSLGFGLGAVAWKDIEVESLPGGQPVLRLQGRALRRARELGVEQLRVSLSHSQSYAVAFVIAEGSSKRR